jgi:hypothetical protein
MDSFFIRNAWQTSLLHRRGIIAKGVEARFAVKDKHSSPEMELSLKNVA